MRYRIHFHGGYAFPPYADGDVPGRWQYFELSWPKRITGYVLLGVFVYLCASLRVLEAMWLVALVRAGHFLVASAMTTSETYTRRRDVH